MPDVSFEYKRLFKGAKVDAVYDAILEWLGKKGAKIKKAEKPRLISALVGREDVEWNWDREMKRTVDFELVTSPDYVGLSVFQAPVRSTAKRVLESPFQANITWRDWLNDCWDFVQGKVGAAPPAPGTPIRIPSAKAAEAGKAPPPPPKIAPPPPAPKPPPPKPAEEPATKAHEAKDESSA